MDLLENPSHCPSLEEIRKYINNPLFSEFYHAVTEKYHAIEKIEFSKCSLAYGWNIKLKKSGKSLCTIYPGKGDFTVLVVIGEQKQPAVELLLPDLTPEVQKIYRETKEGNGQRWLMIDFTDNKSICQDVLRLIEIRHSR